MRRAQRGVSWTGLVLWMALGLTASLEAQSGADALELVDGRTILGELLSFNGETFVILANGARLSFPRAQVFAAYPAARRGASLATGPKAPAPIAPPPPTPVRPAGTTTLPGYPPAATPTPWTNAGPPPYPPNVTLPPVTLPAIPAYPPADGSPLIGRTTPGQSARLSPAGALQWVGLDEDRVGAWNSPKPSGAPDGHFRLRLPSDLDIRSIALFSSNAAGQPEAGQYWHTENTLNYIIGVARSGGPLVNLSGQKAGLGRYAAGEVFDLYAEDSGYFKEGQHFTIVIETQNGARSSMTVRIGNPAIVSGSALDFRWVGLDADRVGSWNSPKPSGAPDGHFRLRLPSDLDIRSIALFSSNAAGQPEAGQYWHTENTSNYIVGVARGGGPLVNALGQRAGLGRFAAGELIDLYAEDSGYFRAGQHFTIEIEAAGGSRVKLTTQVFGVK